MSTQIVETKAEAAEEPVSLGVPAPTVLRGVSYREYVRIRNHVANNGLRLTYHDGTLEIMSPQYAHEVPAIRLGELVRLVSEAFGLNYEGARSTTFRLAGATKKEGFGKEPDECFYFANLSRILNKREIDLNVGDPPPDLWIEVDNRASSLGKLPIYAALGVPEVWRYRINTGKIWFGALTNGEYKSLEHSLALPMLTPELVADAIRMGTGVSESDWRRRIKTWINEQLSPKTQA